MSTKLSNDANASKPKTETTPVVVENNPSNFEQATEIPTGEEPARIDQKEARVIGKVDLNTVKVDVGSKAKKGDAFFVYDSGRFLAEFVYDGGDKIFNVSLDNYLHRGVVHDFAVLEAPKTDA